MAIGDSLFPKKQFYTPQMKAAGVRLIPSGATPPRINPNLPTPQIPNYPASLTKFNKAIQNVDPHIPPPQQAAAQQALPQRPGPGPIGYDFGIGPQRGQEGLFPAATLAGPTVTESVPYRGLGGLLLDAAAQAPTVEGERASPFGPKVPTTLEEQNQEFAQGLKTRGGFFKSLGDALADPGAIKFLASLGASIHPKGLLPIGESAIQGAEAEAQRLFSENLGRNPNADPSTIKQSGLSAEGRRQVLSDRAAREEAATAKERADELYPLKLKQLNQEILAGTYSNQEAKIRLGILEQDFMQRLTNAGANTAEQLVTQGAKAIGIELPDNLNLPKDLTREEAMTILTQAASTDRTVKNVAGRKENSATLSKAAKDARVNTLQQRYQQYQQGVQDAETEGLQRFYLDKMSEIEDKLLEYGVNDFRPKARTLTPGNPFRPTLQTGAQASQAGSNLGKMRRDLKKRGFDVANMSDQEITDTYNALQ